jgi:hypothetical protein
VAKLHKLCIYLLNKTKQKRSFIVCIRGSFVSMRYCGFHLLLFFWVICGFLVLAFIFISIGGSSLLMLVTRKVCFMSRPGDMVSMKV